MKDYLRIIMLVAALFTFAASASAIEYESLTEVPSVESSEDSIVGAKAKGWWQFGVSARYGMPMMYHNEHAVVIGAGYRFDRKNYLGLNIGVAHAEDYFSAYGRDFDYIGCPITLDYTHNFFLGKAKRHSFYLGGELGATFSFGQTAVIKETDDLFHEESLGIPILMLKAGMDFQLYKRLHMNFGFRLGALGLQGSVGFTF